MMTAKWKKAIFFYSCLVDTLSLKTHAGNIIRPNPTLAARQGDYSVSYRQNFCEIQKKIDNEELVVSSALEGLNVHVALATDTDFVKVKGEGKDRYFDDDDPGILVEILDLVAKQGNFSWRDTFVFIDPPENGTLWSDLLFWEIDTYDVSANWWYETVERIGRGATFPATWYDATMIIIAKDNNPISRNSILGEIAWFKPFTAGVWGAIFVTLLISGLVIFFLQELFSPSASNGDEQISGGNLLSSATTHIHRSFITFTLQAGGGDEISHPGRLHSLSLGFFSMLLLSAYTANLASYLVVENTANSAIQVQSVRDIVNNRKSICVFGNTAIQQEIEKVYEDALIVKYNSDKALLIGLKNDECDYAILGKQGWNIYHRDKEVNNDCSLHRVGRDFRRIDAGFATVSDAATKCTSLVRDTFNVHLRSLQNEKLDELWIKFFEARRSLDTADCKLEKDIVLDATDYEMVTLNVINVGDVFLMHFFFIFVSLGMALYSHCATKRKGEENQIEKSILLTRDGKDIFENDCLEIPEKPSIKVREVVDNVNVHSEIHPKYEVDKNMLNRVEKISKEVKNVSSAVTETITILAELRDQVDRIKNSSMIDKTPPQNQ